MRLSTDTAIAAVCVAAVAVYAWPLMDPSREWQFLVIWDDHENFIENNVYKGLSMAHLRGIFTLAIINVWEPLGWLLKALAFATIGLSSRAYRIVTFVLHLGAAWVLAWTGALVLAIMHGGIQLAHKAQAAPDAVRTTTYDLDPSRHLRGCILATLVIFVIHPINVEVVAWPSAQPYALAAFFSSLSLFFHCRRLHRDVKEKLQMLSPRAARGASPEKETMPSDWKRLVTVVAPFLTDRETQLSAVCFVAAVLSKSVCILLPVATVLIDCLILLPVATTIYSRSRYLPTAAQCVRLGLQYLLSKSFHLTAAVLFVTITLVVNHEGAHQHADVITLVASERIIRALSTPAWVLRHILWPASLRPHYRLHEDEVSLLANPEYLLSTAALPLVFAWLASQKSAFRTASLLVVAYFCTMALPTCGLIQHGMVSKGADRYAYFPIMTLIPVGGHWLSRCLALDGVSRHPHPSSAVESTVDRPSRSGKHEGNRLNAGQATLARQVFMVVLAILLAIDTSQMRLWENSENLIEHSLRLDPADSRILHTAYNYQVKWGPGCSGTDPGKCQSWLNLSYHFAPVKTEKAKLYRYMILVLLDRKELACEGYKLMAVEYPQSAVVENNLAICAMLEGKLLEARDRIRRAQTLTMYSSHDRQSISENYFHMVEYITAATTAGGSQLPFNAKLVW